MHLVIIKLCEVLARAGFTAGVTYLLAINQAGQFGIANTLIGLFAFGLGWERHVDIQRRHTGSPPDIFDRTIGDMAPFLGFNYLLMLPVFVLLSFYWAKLDSNVVALACIIVVSEQVFNFAYNISLVDVRYRVFVFLTAFKSVCLFLSLAMLFIFERSMLTLHVIFLIWAIVSGVFSLAIAGLWQARRESLSEAKRNSIASLVFSQHRASLRHFLIGALAVLALQVDRIAVGALLPLEQVGVYFRHIVIISFIYQFFNVASYSRKMSDILHVSRNVSIAAAQKIIFREYAIIASLTFLGMFGLIALDQLLGIEFSSTYSLDRGLAVLLVAGTMVKVLADFFCIILNAHMREHMILKNQLIAVPAGALALVILTLMFGLYGAALALGISSTLYLLLNHLAVRSLSLELNA